MHGYLGLVGLFVIFGSLFWYGRYARGLQARFYEKLERAGFDRDLPLPEALKRNYSFLSARVDSHARVFLLGAKTGGMVALPGGGMTQSVAVYQGFLMPPGKTLPLPLERDHKKALASPLVKDLEDGTQLFLWARPYRPGALEKTLAALMYVLGATAIAEEKPAAPEAKPMQAVSPRKPRPVPPLKRYCMSIYFRSEDCLVSSMEFFSLPPLPADITAWNKAVWDMYPEKLHRLAKEYYTIKGKPDAVLREITINNTHDLSDVPLPPEDDQRPLKHWKIQGVGVCQDVRFGKDFRGVFGWPEEPPEPLAREMAILLIGDIMASTGYGHEYAQYSELKDLTVEPTEEPLSFPDGRFLTA